MSREVRRVPLDWKHPTQPDPYWERMRSTPNRLSKPPSRLHAPGEMFVPLFDQSVSEAQAEWDRELVEWDAGTHEHLTWLLEYHSKDGWTDHKGEWEVNPYQVFAADGETVVREFFPETVTEILEVYPYSEYAGERPTADAYMPDFDVPEDELGWCLYETVSEGTPTTPVFATAEELVDHLATIGQDYDQVPMRRTAAEALVSAGHSLGSMIVAGGVLYRSDRDADLIAELP